MFFLLRALGDYSYLLSKGSEANSSCLALQGILSWTSLAKAKETVHATAARVREMMHVPNYDGDHGLVR